MSLVTIKRIAPSPKKRKAGSPLGPQCNNDSKNSTKRYSNGTASYPARCIFDSLPVEIVVRIISYLGPMEVCRLSQANRFFSSFCKSDIVWRGLFKQRWGPKVPTSTMELPEMQKKLASNLLTATVNATTAATSSPNGSKKKVVPKPSWKDAFKARVFKTCSMCNAIVEGSEALAAWMGFRFCKKCQRERFITKKLGLAMFEIKPKDFEELRYFEIMLGASGRLRHPVRLYYIDDIQSIVETREENQKLKMQNKSKKNKKQKREGGLDESQQQQQQQPEINEASKKKQKEKAMSQEEVEKTKRLEERLIKNQVRPFR